VGNSPLKYTDPMGLDKQKAEDLKKKIEQWEKDKKEWEERRKNDPPMWVDCGGGGKCATEGEHENKYPHAKPTK